MTFSDKPVGITATPYLVLIDGQPHPRRCIQVEDAVDLLIETATSLATATYTVKYGIECIEFTLAEIRDSVKSHLVQKVASLKKDNI